MGSKQDKKLADETAAKIVNILNTQHPAIEWPFQTVSAIVAAALIDKGNQVWDEAAQVVHGTLAPFTSDGVKAGVAGISDLLMLALEEAKAKDGGG